MKDMRLCVGSNSQLLDWSQVTGPQWMSLGQFFPTNEMMSPFSMCFSLDYPKNTLMKFLHFCHYLTSIKNSCEHNVTLLMAILHTWANLHVLHICKDTYVCKCCACELHFKIEYLKNNAITECGSMLFIKSKNISNDQELIQSDPTFCPQKPSKYSIQPLYLFIFLASSLSLLHLFSFFKSSWWCH